MSLALPLCLAPVRRLARFALGGALAAALCGCATVEREPPAVPVAPVAVAQPAPTRGPALWKVADEDTTIYLFGTVHALPAGIDWMDERIAAALASSGEFVTEVKTGPDSGISAGFQSRATLPPGQSLRAMLTGDDLAAYEGALASLGLPASAFDRYEPWYAAMMLSLLPLMQQGYSAEAGVENTLEARLAPQTRHDALETVDFQLGLFDGLPQESQIAYLREIIISLPEIKDTLDAMVAEWLEGDAEALAALLQEGETDPVLFDRLVSARNRNWADWIAQRLDRPGTVFLAVGAGHLAGRDSVQDDLAARGIAALRVP